jgi:hypothetical protein
MSVPKHITPQRKGDSPSFLHRLKAWDEMLPFLFAELDRLKLSRAHQGLKNLEYLEYGGIELCRYDRLVDSINICPMLYEKGQRVDFAFYKAFGRRMWKFISPSDKLKWLRLEVVPPKNVVELVASWFKQNEWSAIKKTGTGMELVVLETLKAIFSTCNFDVRVLDLKAYPPAASLMDGTSRVCIKSVLSKFTGDVDHDVRQFEDAFAEYCVNSGRIRLTDESIEEAINGLFREITIQ